jgi:Domain of Unknown Function (DUF1080)
VGFHGDGVYVANFFGILFRASSGATPSSYPTGMGAGVFQIRSFATSALTYTGAAVTVAAAPVADNATFDYMAYDPSTQWHTYRLEVRGDDLRLLIDGQDVVEVVDPTFSSQVQIGLFSTTCRIQVRDFSVKKL